MRQPQPMPLPDRIKKSRAALRDWKHEMHLPWRDKAMVATIAEVEINLLREMCVEAPPAEFEQLRQLLHDWDELRLSTLD